jgi:hypothetical protein
MADGLTFEERLILDIWSEVEDKCTSEVVDEIADSVGVGWAALIGTVAGLREKRDLFIESNEHD